MGAFAMLCLTVTLTCIYAFKIGDIFHSSSTSLHRFPTTRLVFPLKQRFASARTGMFSGLSLKGENYIHYKETPEVLFYSFSTDKKFALGRPSDDGLVHPIVAQHPNGKTSLLTVSAFIPFLLTCFLGRYQWGGLVDCVRTGNHDVCTAHFSNFTCNWLLN